MAHDQAQQLKSNDSPTLSLTAVGDPMDALARLCAAVASGERPYEDIAEQVEDKAYELCEAGALDNVVVHLAKVTRFFERMTSKNDEQCRDLADVYLLIGQIHQFAGQFAESITWFTRSAVVDDRYPAPYHSLAASYTRLREYENAIKSFEQEIILAPGNYYSYLLLADLYEREYRPDDVESCLKRLLERDPENIQGLHRIIRHYEQTEASIETTLMIRHLLGVNKQYNRTEAVIRCYYLCRTGKYAEVLDFLGKRRREADGGMVASLINAHVYGELHQYSKRRQVLNDFKQSHHERSEAILAKLKEFGAVFGDDAANALQKLLLIPEVPEAATPRNR